MRSDSTTMLSDANARGKVGILLLILSESAFFAVFLVAYLFYLGKSLNPPYPEEVLEFPVLATICLLSSSLTIHFAVQGLRRDQLSRFALMIGVTLLLGGTFLFITAQEWQALIYEDGLTVRTNLFGTTYFSLVGFHAAHVCMGVFIMMLLFSFWLMGSIEKRHAERVELFSWYWHFVDLVWLAVLAVVYVVGV